MANHASHAALPYPVKGARFTVAVPYLDATGTPTDPTTPDTEVSKDGAAYADCTEEVTTIIGANGSGYITLTGAELDASVVMVAAKVASGPKTTLATLYPRVLPICQSGTAQAGAVGTLTLAAGAAAIDDYYVGCLVKTTGGTGGGGVGGANNQARVIIDYVGATKVATVSPNWETAPDATTTYAILVTESGYFRMGDLMAWRGALPNALSGGRVDAVVGAITNGVMAAASFAAGAFDAVWTVTTRAVTDKVGFAIAAGGLGAGAHAAAELNAIADALLDRNLATGTDSGTDTTAVRTVRQALRRLRNREAMAAGVLTTYKEDDVTASWTAAATTAAGNPLTEVNPT